MISPFELRIGNQLQNLVVVEILKDNIVAKATGEEEVDSKFEDLIPLDLNKELLEMYGFVFQPGSEFGSLHQSPLWLNLEDGGWYIRMNNSYVNRSNPIKTVHHLQNIWFAITGRELEFIPE